MLSVDEARARILEAMAPRPEESVMLAQAAGRVLARPAVARRSQPGWDVSAMDGYAVRADDVAAAPVELTVVGEAPAGGAYAGELAPGEAVRIFTGGPVPAGADTIVIQEDTQTAGERGIRVRQSAPPGKHIRRAGIDFTAGETVIAAGTRLTPRHIMLAASAELPWLEVHQRPRVALIATGDELVRPGEPVGAAQIVQSVTPALAAFVEARGAVAHDLGIARDRQESIQALAGAGAGADLVVTVGGASVGDYDRVQSGLGQIGMELDFWKIAQRPGKPMLFGRLGTAPFVGLPGNPVSALVCALLYIGPAVDALTGAAPRLPMEVTGELAAPLGANKQREAYLNADIVGERDGRPVLRVHESQDSSVQSALARADALVIRAPGAPAAAAGEAVRAYILDPAPGA